MSEWKEYRFSEIIELIGGGTPKTSNPEYWNGEIPWLSVADFNTGRKYVSCTEKMISEKGLKESSTKLLNSGDIIISARGTVGVVAMLKKPMTFNQSCYGIRAIENLSTTDYVYYLLKDTISGFQQIAHGGVFDTITKDTFKEIEILLPSLPEQNAIASILSSLDDKIDLLHRQNATLEKMAETLFRQWFVERFPDPVEGEAKEEWEEKPLSFFGAIICGKTPPKSKHEYFNGKIPFIKIPDMHGKIFVFDSEDSLNKCGRDFQANKTLPPFSISVSCIATVGLVTMNAFESQTNQQINSIIPIKDYYRYFLYLQMNSMYDELHAMASGGTATLNLNTSNFAKITVPYVDDNYLINFNEVTKPLFDKVYNNQTQIRTLTALRDTLLPKLMSGEIRIEKMELI